MSADRAQGGLIVGAVVTAGLGLAFGAGVLAVALTVWAAAVTSVAAHGATRMERAVDRLEWLNAYERHVHAMRVRNDIFNDLQERLNRPSAAEVPSGSERRRLLLGMERQLETMVMQFRPYALLSTFEELKDELNAVAYGRKPYDMTRLTRLIMAASDQAQRAMTCWSGMPGQPSKPPPPPP